MAEPQLDTPKEQAIIYSVPFLTNEHNEFVLWFYTGSKCNLECSHCYVESGPHADQHPMLSYETFEKKLNEAVNKQYSKLEIYFTGGEPFVNRNLIKMLQLSLKFADTTVLTNGTRITDDIAEKLQKLQNITNHVLTFRVSLDGANAQENDLIRGKDAFKRANRGITNLVNHGFNPIITTLRSWSLLEQGKKQEEFVDLLIDQGIPREDQILKILPPIRSGREVTRSRPYTTDELFTEECFTDYDYNKLQCSKCRMVSERGVWVCPILINKESAKMGETVEEASHAYEMKDMECWTCRMDGLTCEN